ncbi:formylglycine-generating enzyme family protein [Peredibacter sp. HCB2-198]|uniref:formylglycine-generating enzyme family protein n=1 Tax=Peredibacter sp. HCB2-198 TaxID=3383025 RepID=UPI0038B612CF
MLNFFIPLIFVSQVYAASLYPGMMLIPGGEFRMGSDDKNAYPPERPAHSMHVSGFHMDITEVTNEQYEKFVKETGYLTVAERKPNWEELKKQLPPGTPKPDDKVLVPGSSVFTPPKNPVNLDEVSWWQWTPGASWKHPEGPGSSIANRLNHPVVHVAYEDAVNFCEWAKKRLPTEAEWEFAARGGLLGKRYAWGDDLYPKGKYMANTFQGKFPYADSKQDGFTQLAPVGSFPKNGYGLHDMIGNAWEWVGDWYNDKLYAERVAKRNRKTPPKCHDSTDALAQKRVIKGGSYLCSEEYCANYRPSARRGTAFDTGMSHISFRCVRDI